MCTVTYLPLDKGEFILTSNRDESIVRAAALPVMEYKIGNSNVYYPKDQKAGGTWIAHESNGYTLCLLNGAFEPHEPKKEYRKSRGLMLLDFFNYNSVEKFIKEYDFTGIEPFTLVVVYTCSETKQIFLNEIKWNETEPVIIPHDSGLPQIWSSVTLYSPQVREMRKTWFNNWLNKQNAYSGDEILFFHHFGGEGMPENDLVINRGEKKTVSVCCINRAKSFTEITYEDILNKKLYKNKVFNC